MTFRCALHEGQQGGTNLLLITLHAVAGIDTLQPFLKRIQLNVALLTQTA